MTPMLIIENIATMAFTAAIVLGLYYMGAGWLSLSGFILLFNMNNPRIRGK